MKVSQTRYVNVEWNYTIEVTNANQHSVTFEIIEVNDKSDRQSKVPLNKGDKHTAKRDWFEMLLEANILQKKADL